MIVVFCLFASLLPKPSIHAGNVRFHTRSENENFVTVKEYITLQQVNQMMTDSYTVHCSSHRSFRAVLDTISHWSCQRQWL